MFDIVAEFPAAQAARTLERLTRRQVARRMTEVGRLSVRGAQGNASRHFRPRPEDRRRYPGTDHYHDSFTAIYTGLSEFAGGLAEVALSSSSPVANILEYGSAGGYVIRARNKKKLAWPDMRGGPKDFVVHPGIDGFPVMRTAIEYATAQQFPGIRPRFSNG